MRLSAKHSGRRQLSFNHNVECRGTAIVLFGTFTKRKTNLTTTRLLQAEGYDPFYDPFVLLTRDGQFNFDLPAKPLFEHNAPTTPEKVEELY